MSSTSSRPLGYLLQVTHVGPKFNKHAVRIVGRERGGKTFPHIFPYYFLLLPLSFSSIYDGIIVFKILFPAWLYILCKRRLFSISFFADSLIFSPACFYHYSTCISATCCCLSTRFSNKRRYTCFQFVVWSSTWRNHLCVDICIYTLAVKLLSVRYLKIHLVI